MINIEKGKNLIERIEKNVCNLQQRGLRSKTIYEKMYWDNYIGQEIYKKYVLEELINYIEKISLATRQGETVFTLDELLKFNGKNNNPAYIAIDGIVYDVTFEPSWGGATHFGLTAGRDLTKEFKSCHNSQIVLNKLKKVGILKQ